MQGIIPIIIVVLVGSLGGLAGGILLLFDTRLKNKLVHTLVPFAAGALLSISFLDLIPEATEHSIGLTGKEISVFMWVLFGILLFYLMERVIHWFQYHRTENKAEHKRATIPLIMIGDSIHNFIDGMVIAVTFLVDPTIGVITTLAVIAHEIPQEVGDFAVMLHEGMSGRRVLLYNFLSALLSVLGAAIILIVGDTIQWIFPYALSLTAGMFIYIALTNLLPIIHSEEKKGYAFKETVSLFLGVIAIWMVATYLSH